MPLLRHLVLFLLCICFQACGKSPVASDHAEQIKSLIEPAKLQTLGERGANTRVRKITAILFRARAAGQEPGEVAIRATELIGWGGTDKGKLTAAAMARNLTIIERLGSTTPEDIAAMERGRAPKVRTGPYTGQVVSVDHIIPRSVVPELDNVIANLELMPLGLNEGKSNRVTSRQVDLAKKMLAAGLLTEEGFRRVATAAK